MRECLPKHWELIRCLRLRDDVQQYLHQQLTDEELSKERQTEYMLTNHKYYHVCETADGDFIGFVSLIPHLDGVKITILISPEYQGEGIGTYMIQWVCDNYNDKLYADVHLENKSSMRIFIKNGFKEKTVTLIR